MAMKENEEHITTDDELYEHFKFNASEGQEPLRVDKFLMNFIENATRNKIQQAVKAGNVLVNDAVVKSNYKVKANDVVRVVLAHPPHENLLVPEDIPLDIIYEDDEVIVVNKPAGMVVHPGHGNYSGTLVNGLIYHFENLPKNRMTDLVWCIGLIKTPVVCLWLPKQNWRWLIWLVSFITELPKDCIWHLFGAV